MLTNYPWFRRNSPTLEQRYDRGVVTYSWLQEPGPFIGIDTRLLNDRYANPRTLCCPEKIEPGAVVTLAGVSFVLLRLNLMNGVEWYAVRKDVWTPLLRLLDTCLYALSMREARTLYWLMPRWKNDQLRGERPQWSSLAGLHWLRKVKAAD